MTRHERLLFLMEKLSELYPNAHCELHYNNPLELLVATILSAQCTDVRVNKVTPALFERCRSILDYAEIPHTELEKIIHSTGFFRSKAKAIKGSVAALLEQHGGKVPQSLRALSALPGVGRKTANVVLGDAFGIHEGIVVDTHVRRISQRLGLTQENHPVKIEQALMKLIDRQYWGILGHWFTWHGRRSCSARKPNCIACGLRHLCPSSDQPDRFFSLKKTGKMRANLKTPA